MGKSIISLLLLTAAWLPGVVAADEVQLAENAPDRYVVVKGDTLWGISGRFLRDPWRWPDVWGLNKDEIKNPHWIYPGDVVILDFTGKTPRLRREGDTAGAAGDGRSGEWNLITTKLSPAIRKQALAALAIPTVSLETIGPFLTQALVVGERELVRGLAQGAHPGVDEPPLHHQPCRDRTRQTGEAEARGLDAGIGKSTCSSRPRNR